MDTMELSKKLRGLLAYNIVTFTYRKKDGSIRNARGTRNLAVAEKALGESVPSPKTDRINPNAYYDLNSRGWRSYCTENLISIDKVEDGDFVAEPKNMRVEGTETAMPTMGGGMPMGGAMGGSLGAMPMGGSFGGFNIDTLNVVEVGERIECEVGRLQNLSSEGRLVPEDFIVLIALIHLRTDIMRDYEVCPLCGSIIKKK